METASLYSGIFTALLLIIFLMSGFFMGRKVRNASEFDKGGGKSGTFLVAGSIIGTLVGGSSTVGTAQLAFNYGLSALWFTLGSATGCILLAVLFSKPLRRSGCTTLAGLVSDEYGVRTGTIVGILSSFGLFINLIAQILASEALLSVLFPINPVWHAVISAVMMFLYVFGGVRGTGYLGAAKTLLLCITVVSGAVVCLVLNGGINNFTEILPKQQYFNLFARGAGIDIGAGLSVVFGVVSTQTYAQALLSAKNDGCAVRGALLSALIIPLIGIGSLLIGYFMRVTFPEMNPAQAFPQFIINYMPPYISHLMLVALLITVMGTGAGISLGLSSTVSNDLIKRFMAKNTDNKKMLYISRMIIALALTISVFVTQSSLKTTILTWGFMSMGLRAVVMLLPVFCALFLPKKTKPLTVVVSAAAGLILMMIAFLSPISEKTDPLLMGMTVVGAVYLFSAFAEHINRKIKE